MKQTFSYKIWIERPQESLHVKRQLHTCDSKLLNRKLLHFIVKDCIKFCKHLLIIEWVLSTIYRSICVTLHMISFNPQEQSSGIRILIPPYTQVYWDSERLRNLPKVTTPTGGTAGIQIRVCMASQSFHNSVFLWFLLKIQICLKFS